MKNAGTVKEEIDWLRKEIERHNYKYYVLNQPEISDYEFDQMMQRLIQLEKQYPEYEDPNSPTKRVGGAVTKEFRTVKHEIPMYSLDNSYSREEVTAFHQRVARWLGKDPSYVCELKYDGIAISILYEDGKFVRAVTRGDGEKGDDISENVRTVRSVPLHLNGEVPGKLYALGEIFMPRKEFQRLNKERRENGEPEFANPRNATGGTLKLQDSSEVARRKLDCFMYYIAIPHTSSFTGHYEALMAARRWGFKVPLPEEKYIMKCRSVENIFEFIDYWEHRREELPFEVDGVVIKVNDYVDQKSLGYTSKSPRWAIAFKYHPEQAVTRLESVSFQVGRTGVITPVANLKPVLLSGTTVKRASLYNADQIEALDLHIGDYVVVEKGGEIIPKIVGVDRSKRDLFNHKVKFPSVCPACGIRLVKDAEQALWYCPNEWGCEPQLKGKIVHFTHRKAMNIEGLGEETVDLLFDEGLVKTIADIYTLTEEKLSNLERWGEKSARNLIRAIEKSKEVPFERVLFALGIRYVGETTARKLARRFRNIDNLMQADIEELKKTEEVGDVIARSIKDFFMDPRNIEIIRRLKKAGLRFSLSEESVPVQSNKLVGKTFVVSGVFSKFSREGLKHAIEANGGKVTSSVSGNTDYIVAGENMGPAKLEKAQKLGVKIISEDDFLKMIE